MSKENWRLDAHPAHTAHGYASLRHLPEPIARCFRWLTAAGGLLSEPPYREDHSVPGTDWVDPAPARNKT